MALEKIGLISAVSDLPNKLETLLDEGGSFSAGQVAFSRIISSSRENNRHRIIALAAASLSCQSSFTEEAHCGP
jgi:hypothetical protein